METVSKLPEQRVDAIIICGGRIDIAQPDPEFVELINKALETTPIVVGSVTAHKRLFGVAVDHERSMDVALDYILGLGHKDIGFMYTGIQFYGTRQRLQRFRLHMARAGLPVREEWLVPVKDYDCPSGREGIKELLKCSHLPTALLGMNDLVTAGALQWLLEHGVRMPEDISLVGFDDTFITTLTSPELTAVDYDYNYYSRELMDAAMLAIEGKTPPYNRLIAPSLSIKKSCLKLCR